MIPMRVTAIIPQASPMDMEPIHHVLCVISDSQLYPVRPQQILTKHSGLSTKPLVNILVLWLVLVPIASQHQTEHTNCEAATF
eukprot:UN3948